MNSSVEFLKALEDLRKKEIPSDVLARARQSLLDYLAVTCAGTKFQEEKLKRYFDFSEYEAGNFKAIGTGKSLPLKEAVFLNGLNGHALDFDDGTNSGIIHLGSPIFSLLIPLAQKYKISVDEMLKAAIIGYEASYTMAVSIQPGHKARGYHATGTCGTLGATIAATYMLGFSEEERFQAFSVACVAAGGMLKVLDDGSELKPYNVAKTALLSLTALQMAKSGFKGHSDPLGGRGFLMMMAGNEDIPLKPVLLNGTYAVMKTYTKPYASCRYTHPAVEGAIQLRSEISLNEIEKVNIKTYGLAVSGHNHTEIPGSYSAKMSIPYAAAVGFIYGKAGLQEFSEDIIKNPQVQALTRKIEVVEDTNLSAEFPRLQAAIVTVKTKSKEYIKMVDYPKGEPENPLTDVEFRERYNSLLEYSGISFQIAESIFNTVYKENATVEEIISSL